MTSRNDNEGNLEPGTRVLIHDLKSEVGQKLNGKEGKLICFHMDGVNAGRWGVSMHSGTMAIKPENLKKLATRLPPLLDKWGLTTISQAKCKEYRGIMAQANSVEQAEKAIFIAENNGDRNLEGYMFPNLFPFGTGFYTASSSAESLDRYVDHCLLHSSGIFLEDRRWLCFMTKRVAAVRAAAGKSDNEAEELKESEADLLVSFAEQDPQRAFCFRYLAGDRMAVFLSYFLLKAKLEAKR